MADLAAATPNAVPPRCTACDAAIPHGRDRCPACGKVYGEWNRCPSCHAIAAVHEKQRGRFVCAACSAPRTRHRSTPIDADFAQGLQRRAWLTRAGAFALWPTGFGLGTVGGLVLGAGQVIGMISAYANGIGGAFLALGAVALLVARRLGKRAAQLAEQARQERLLMHVRWSRAGVTAGEAAHALHILPTQADAALTLLAKRGEIDLDVDDRGTVRYRVAPVADEEEEPPPSARRDRFREHE
jgi:hypothetical protein